MAQADSGASVPTPKNVAVAQAVIHGRITARRQYKTREGARMVATLLRMPAPDAYSSPATVEVHSSNALGQPGDDVTVTVRVSGYGRSYRVTDAETGEHRSVQTADVRLTVVEV